MTEPRIQYVSSADGVKIAYWTLGSGGVPLLTQSPMAYSNISLDGRTLTSAPSTNGSEDPVRVYEVTWRTEGRS